MQQQEEFSWLKAKEVEMALVVRSDEWLELLHRNRVEEFNAVIGPHSEGVDLKGDRYPNARWDGIRLAGADLREIWLEGASLRGANLAKANLSAATLFDADFTEADLVGAQLTAANMLGVRLAKANLRGANLQHTDLRGADLHEADLTGAVFEQATAMQCLRGANLWGVKGLSQKIFEEWLENLKASTHPIVD